MSHPVPSITNRTVHVLDEHGFIRDWLVSPAWSHPCEDLGEELSADDSPWGAEGRWVLTNGPDVGDLKERLFRSHPIFTSQPLPPIEENAPIEWISALGPVKGEWRRWRSPDDALVDWSQFCFTPEYREALAATCIEVDQAEWRELRVECTGPFVCWLNGEVVLTGSTVSYMEPQVSSVRIRIPSGLSTLHIATWQVAFRECRQIVRVRIGGLPVRVVIPSPGADEYAAAVADSILSTIGSVSWALRGPEGSTARVVGTPGVSLKVRRDGGQWQGFTMGTEGTADIDLRELACSSPGPTEVDATSASMLTTGESRLEVAIADERAPQCVLLRVAKLQEDSTVISEGTPERWRHEVLEHLAKNRGTIASVVAQSELGILTVVEESDLEAGLTLIETRGDCADFELVGLLHLWNRIPEDLWPDQLRARVKSAFTSMKYWIDQPGLDAMCFFTENHQFVWHVAQRLAGIAFADEQFTNDARTGAAHAEEGGRRALDWIRRKLGGGFSEFDSNAYLAIDSMCLATLIEFDPDPVIADAAGALLDTLLLTLVSNSWRGVHSAAHGRTYVQTLRSARSEETSSILRLIGGVGSLNTAVLPVATLATARRYTIPDVLREIARSVPATWEATQSYRGQLAFERDLLSRPYGSDVCIWKTAHGVLSSVQDYRAGLPGLQELVGSATLGREARVFVTMPANNDSGSSARPNAWAGQKILPRVRQYRNVMLSQYPTTPGNTATRSHLWLPLAQFDEWTTSGDWIAARLGDAYVAVATSGGVEAVRSGDTAQQEFHPKGRGDQWITVLGSIEDSPSLATWVASLGVPSFGKELSYQTPVGDTLRLSWAGPFLINDVPADVDESGRISQPFRLRNPAVSLRFGDPILHAEWHGKTLEVDLQTGRRVSADLTPIDAAQQDGRAQ